MSAAVRSLPSSLAVVMRHLAPWQERTLCCCGDITPVVKEISAALSAYAYSLQDFFAVELSLREALTNAIRHGNRNDPTKQVKLRYLVLHDHVWIEVEDEGHGFQIAEVPDPRQSPYLERTSGRGVFLMRTYMTGVHYNHRGNSVLMHKRRGDLPRTTDADSRRDVYWEGA